MSNYDFLTTLEPTVFKRLIASNVIRPTVEREMQMYVHYNKLCERLPRMQARLETADKFCTSEETVKRTIKRLK